MMLGRMRAEAALAAMAAFSLAAALLVCLAWPQTAAAQQRGRSTGLDVPRFVSLRADEVNLRTGPGLRYPIEWVYKRQDLPVEVIDEFEAWRRIRDWDGTVGWVHGAMLQSKRTVRVIGSDARLLRAGPDGGSDGVALVQPGVIGELDRCEGEWCRLAVADYVGWLPRAAIYGARPGGALE